MGFMPLTPPSGPSLRIGIDHLEAIRLYDVEGFDQEEAAVQMNVSRATFGRIIRDAHCIIGRALISGRGLIVVEQNPIVVECKGPGSHFRLKKRRQRTKTST